MITDLVEMARTTTNGLNFDRLAPRCDNEGCPGNRARWHGLLRRFDGLRFDGGWYCSAHCFRAALEFRIGRLFAEHVTSQHTARHRMPIGLILLSRGTVHHDQLLTAMQQQRAIGGLFGQILVQLGFATEEQVVAAVASQWGCPVYPVGRSSECQHLVPQLLQERYLMTPIHWVPATRDLYVAFTRTVNHTLLYSIQRMLECHTIPCFISDSSLSERVGRGTNDIPDSEVSIETRTNTREICETVLGYTQQTGAEEVRVFACDTHFWIRMENESRHFDLLFRRD